MVTGQLAIPGPLPGLIGDGDLVYAPHLYNESIGILPGSIEEGFDSAAAAAASYGTTFFSGEWGWFGDAAADQAKLERYAAAEDAHLVGGTWWQWAQACGDPHAIPARHERPPCAGRSPYSDGLVTRSPANVAVLSRAYPRAAPGVLESIDADVRSGELIVTGTADRPGVAADLWAPARCAAPAVSGTNVGPAAARAVEGGWRIAVPVPDAGPYQIALACDAPAAAPSPSSTAAATGGQRLPATGGDDARGWAAASLLGLALLVRAGRRAVQRR